MLPITLNTNEVKNSAGTEVEFVRLRQLDRTTEFAQVSETPMYPHRLKISHLESGTGTKARRRSLIRVDKKFAGADGDPVVASCYMVSDIPTGNLANYDEVKNVMAEVVSFVASTGADTTIKYDCSGNGATALVTGGQ